MLGIAYRLDEVRAVLAAVKTALRRWPPASLDRRCARAQRSLAGRDGGTALWSN